MKLDFSPEWIYLRRGIILRRESLVPLSALTVIEIKRSPLLRVVGAKRVTVKTLAGEIEFFLAKNESLPFLPEKPAREIRAKRGSILLGAFSDTRALSAVVFFCWSLSRVSKILGSEYYDKIISVITEAAGGISEALVSLHIIVPRVTAVAAAFVLAGWGFSFLRRLILLLRFRVSRRGGYVTIRRGIITLYEQTLVLNNLNALVCESSVTSLLFSKSALYARGIMLFPPSDEPVRKRLARFLCGISFDFSPIYSPPRSALFSHCAVPLGWGAGFLGGVVLCHVAYLLGAAPQLPILRSFLWLGAAISLWTAILWGVFMRRSFLAVGKDTVAVSARKGTRIRTAIIPKREIAAFQNNISLFQRKKGLRDIAVIVKQGGAIKLRHAKGLF